MKDPPPLLGVSHALPVALQGALHVLQLVSSFLLPASIDFAVCHNLLRVLNVFGRSSACSSESLDDAAARERLGALRRVLPRPFKSCSSAAFIGAASNGHVDVLAWLREHYPSPYQIREGLTAAAAAGQLNVVNFLGSVSTKQCYLQPALEAAAANGHTEVVRTLLTWPNYDKPFGLGAVFDLAAEKGNVEVLQLLLRRGDVRRVSPAFAPVVAAQRGHLEVAKLLLPTCGNQTVLYRALDAAVEQDHVNVVKLILEKCDADEQTIALVLRGAVERSDFDMAKLLVEYGSQMTEKNPQWGVSEAACRWEPVQSIMKATFRAATEQGDMKMVELLVDKCALLGKEELQLAIVNRQCQVAKLLLDLWDAGDTIYTDVSLFVEAAACTAVSCGDIESAKLLVEKCSEVQASRVLRRAVEENKLDMIELFAGKSAKIVKISVLLRSASAGRLEVVKIVARHSGRSVLREVLARLRSPVDIEVVKLLSEKCDSGGLDTNDAKNGETQNQCNAADD